MMKSLFEERLVSSWFLDQNIQVEIPIYALLIHEYHITTHSVGGIDLKCRHLNQFSIYA